MKRIDRNEVHWVLGFRDEKLRALEQMERWCDAVRERLTGMTTLMRGEDILKPCPDNG
jgi:hypothetical protein